VNYTSVMEQISNDPNLDDAFPRWLATTKLINPQSRILSTSAVAIIGDSKKERDIGVAQGFTTYVLQKDEIMVPEIILNILGLKEGDHLEL